MLSLPSPSPHPMTFPPARLKRCVSVTCSFSLPTCIILRPFNTPLDPPPLSQRREQEGVTLLLAKADPPPVLLIPPPPTRTRNSSSHLSSLGLGSATSPSSGSFHSSFKSAQGSASSTTPFKQQTPSEHRQPHVAILGSVASTPFTQLTEPVSSSCTGPRTGPRLSPWLLNWAASNSHSARLLSAFWSGGRPSRRCEMCFQGLVSTDKVHMDGRQRGASASALGPSGPRKRPRLDPL